MTKNWNYKMSRKMIMVNAHHIAKITNRSIKCYAIAYKVALKYVWNSVKKYNKASFGDIALDNACTKIEDGYSLFGHQDRYFDGIPEWILRKNLEQFEYQAIVSNFCGARVVRETEKAIDFDIDTDFGGIYIWVPKSVMNYETENQPTTNDLFDCFAA